MLGSAFRKHIGPPVAVFGLLVGIVAITAFLYVAVAPNAHAYVAPRPTVELVKVFICELSNDYRIPCAAKLEGEANKWLQSVQPGARIIGRSLAASKYYVVLTYHYEVLEWRTPQPKPPAEAP